MVGGGWDGVCVCVEGGGWDGVCVLCVEGWDGVCVCVVGWELISGAESGASQG